MIDSHLNLGMTATAKRDKVMQLIGNIHNKIVPPCVDVVSVQCPSAWTALRATPATNLVSFKDLAANTLPFAAMSKVSSTTIVRVIRAGHPDFRTGMGAKRAVALYLRCKGAKLFAALSAGDRLSRNKSCVSAFGRTVTNLCVLWMKFLAAYLAGRYKLILLAPFPMAFWRAKVIYLRIPYLAAWFSVWLAAVVTRQSYGALLALIGASATAQENLLVIGLELFPALGANFEHC